MNDQQSVFDLTIPQLDKYSRGEVLSAAKMNETVEVVNRIARGLKPPEQMRRKGREPDEKNKKGSATGLYKITPDLHADGDFMMIREVDPETLRDSGRNLHMPSRAKRSHTMGVCGDDKIIWHVHGGAVASTDAFDNTLWEIDAERMAVIRGWKTTNTGVHSLLDFSDLDSKPDAIGGGADLFAIGGQSSTNPDGTRFIWLIQPREDNRQTLDILGMYDVRADFGFNQQPSTFGGITIFNQGDSRVLMYGSTRGDVYRVDITDTSNPVGIRIYPGSGTIKGLSVIGQKLYAAEADSGGGPVIQERKINLPAGNTSVIREKSTNEFDIYAFG